MKPAKPPSGGFLRHKGRLQRAFAVPIFNLFGASRAMDINAHVITGSDPGAVPGGSTKITSLGDHGAEIGSTNV